MNTNDRPQGRTSRVTPHIWIGQGGVRQNGGSLPLYRCNGCGTDVVWVESRRTGNKYLANVSRTARGDGRFYIGANVHTQENCQARQADIAREARNIQREQWRREGKCWDCGDEPTFDHRLDEPHFRCMDCQMEARREALEALAQAEA